MTPQSRREKWRVGLRDHIAAGVDRGGQAACTIVGVANRARGLAGDLGRFAQNLAAL